ncbi:MAG: energy transducer TonB [Pyrinomonadaceae bacterium]
MKKCTACAEEFADKFSFCPVDGTPLNSLAAALTGYSTAGDSNLADPEWRPYQRSVDPVGYEYNPTILSNAGLLKRLAAELLFAADRFKAAWPAFKHDPIGAGKQILLDWSDALNAHLTPRIVVSGLTALCLVLSTIFLTLLFGGRNPSDKIALNGSDIPSVEILTLASLDPTKAPSDSGVGVGSQGRVGFDRGRGEGSKAQPQPARGGGGGGNGDKSPQQKGKIPQVSEIPAPIPKLPPAREQALPHAGIDIDPALWKQLQFPSYGDPRSNSTIPSNGPGNGGGMGTANGPGIGEGNGDGVGPGSDGNMGGKRRGDGGGGIGGSSGDNPEDPNRIFPPSLVGQRARVLSKPEPQYTDEARRNQITGTVVLRVVFSRSGDVINVRAVQTLPFGLTEKAITAARQIRFVPATKDGHPVSVYMQLEYNFNLY